MEQIQSQIILNNIVIDACIEKLSDKTQPNPKNSGWFLLAMISTLNEKNAELRKMIGEA
ncbi:MAG: hypothetical protein IJ889_06810 [Eubacterium sp.]|nr:hypothetical protein [Eubacterium sp.]MBR2214115.1 hypothetical protein [Eubacterium sp.]MBR2247404.1 hypothetical protein [Bacilli bacterium]